MFTLESLLFLFLIAIWLITYWGRLLTLVIWLPNKWFFCVWFIYCWKQVIIISEGVKIALQTTKSFFFQSCLSEFGINYHLICAYIILLIRSRQMFSQGSLWTWETTHKAHIKYCSYCVNRFLDYSSLFFQHFLSSDSTRQL